MYDVWTGTLSDGTGAPNQQLGQHGIGGGPVHGLSISTEPGSWVKAGIGPFDQTFRLYGISSELTVPGICRPRAGISVASGHRDQRGPRLRLVPSPPGLIAAQASGTARRARVSGGRVPRASGAGPPRVSSHPGQRAPRTRLNEPGPYKPLGFSTHDTRLRFLCVETRTLFATHLAGLLRRTAWG